MSTQHQPFDRFMATREAAAKAYVNGDAAPLEDIVAHASPATFFAPRGGYRQGAQEVAATYAADARSFQPNSETNLEVLQSGESGDLAFWTGLQRAKVRMSGHDQPVGMDLRVTEIFRREDGGWKLIHRHADTLAAPPPSPSN